MNYEKALRFPFAEENGPVKLLIGAVISLIPIVNFISIGYLFKLADNILKGDLSMPDWTNLGEKFIQGIMVFIVTFIYMLIPLIIVIAGGGLGHLGRGELGFFFAGFILAFIVAVVIGFILPMALMNFVETGRLGAAFDFRTIVDYIGGRLSSYFLTYVILIGLYIVLAGIAAIPVIGWILGIVGAFYISCVACYLFGHIYRDAAMRGQIPPVV